MSGKLCYVRTLWVSSQSVEFTFISVIFHTFTTIADYFWICTLFVLYSIVILVLILSPEKGNIFFSVGYFWNFFFFGKKEKKRLLSLLFSRIIFNIENDVAIARNDEAKKKLMNVSTIRCSLLICNLKIMNRNVLHFDWGSCCVLCILYCV